MSRTLERHSVVPALSKEHLRCVALVYAADHVLFTLLVGFVRKFAEELGLQCEAVALLGRVGVLDSQRALARGTTTHILFGSDDADGIGWADRAKCAEGLGKPFGSKFFALQQLSGMRDLELECVALLDQGFLLCELLHVSDGLRPHLRGCQDWRELLFHSSSGTIRDVNNWFVGAA